MKKHKKSAFVQFLEYNLGGFLYFASAWLIITFGTQYIGLWWSNLVGNGVGIVVNYIVQEKIAFTSAHRSGKVHTNQRYIVLTAVNLVISYFILKALTYYGVPLWLAQFGSSGFFTVWNWFWYKHWVFESK